MSLADEVPTIMRRRDIHCKPAKAVCLLRIQ